jgi:hypothetical protein
MIVPGGVSWKPGIMLPQIRYKSGILRKIWGWIVFVPRDYVGSREENIQSVFTPPFCGEKKAFTPSPGSGPGIFGLPLWKRGCSGEVL